MAVIHVDSKGFENEVLKASGSVLVDFAATWCGPCKMLAPVLEETEKDLAGKVKVCKLDVDESGDIASRYGVMSVPTLILFKDGQEAARQVGFATKDQIISFVS